MKMRIINISISVLFLLFLYGQVESHLLYQLYQWEHTNLFVGDGDWLLNASQRAGGAIRWIATWFIQFFDRPVVGVLLFLLPVAGIFATAARLLRKQGTIGYLLAALLCVVQLFSLYDYNFYWAGSLALFLVMGLWCILSLIKQESIRYALFLAGIPLTGWWLGSVALVYTLGGILLFVTCRRTVLTILLPLLIHTINIYIMHETGEYPSLKAALSPSLYYEAMLDAPSYHVLPWVGALLIATGSRFLPAVDFKNRIVTATVCLVGWSVPIFLFLQFEGSFRNKSNIDIWRLNHHAYLEDWDAILEFLKEKPMTNYLFMNYANMALAQKGELGNLAFHYSPKGANSLLINTNTGKDASVRMLASDIHYLVGCVAEAQQHAFEAQVAMPTSLGIQSLKRLVKTNLIFGHYKVAEKYLDLIAKTTFHKEWAEKYRTFLYNDKAVETDSELGEKRRSLSKTNRFAMFEGWHAELEDILEANPKNEKAMLYLGLSYLLNKDMEGFRRFLDKYYGTETLQQLPPVFQQAVFVLYEQQQERWNDFALSPQLHDSYANYRELFFKSRNTPNLKNVMRNAYGNTLWYYLMFK